MSKSIVELVRVTKIYRPDVTALDDVSLTVRQGDITFLTGESGAGKTTLLNLLCAVEAPTRGYIEVVGRNVGQLKSRDIPLLRQNIGMAYQDFKLLTERSAAQNIAMAMEVAYAPAASIKRRVRDLLQRLKLENKHDTPAGNLSRGEQQRVAIARAVANTPALILADEPTGNLDAVSTELVMELFAQCNDAGATIIIATHDQSIFHYARHLVLRLHGGRLAAGDGVLPETAEGQDQ